MKENPKFISEIPPKNNKDNEKKMAAWLKDHPKPKAPQIPPKTEKVRYSRRQERIAENERKLAEIQRQLEEKRLGIKNDEEYQVLAEKLRKEGKII